MDITESDEQANDECAYTSDDNDDFIDCYQASDSSYVPETEIEERDDSDS